jgi:Arc/MetJ family transcription regulator
MRAVVSQNSRVIFKAVQDGRPYPAHDLTLRDWSKVPPRQVRLDELVTTKRVLALDVLLDDDSTFYGDLFPHVVLWNGEFYLEDGLHRALRAALQQRTTLHVRVLDLDRPADERVDAGATGADAAGLLGVER